MDIASTEKSAELQSFIDILLLPSTRVILVLSTIILAIILAPILKNKKCIVECNKYFFIVGLCFIASEISKQIYVIGMLGFDWWVYFPAQFSALPLCSFIFMPLCKKEFSRNVIKFLVGPYCFYIGIMFWISPSVIDTAPSWYYVFQSASWHLAMIFFGMFHMIVYKIYTMKYFKPALAAIGCLTILAIIGVSCNAIFTDLQLKYFYCAPWLPVYPVINLFWHSTTPFLPYACVFIVSFIVLSLALFFVNVGVGKICSAIYKQLKR